MMERPFELKQQTARLLALTPRIERHGEDEVNAVTLTVQLSGPNTLLDEIHPGLRPAFYMAVPGQDPLPGVEPPTPLLRTKQVEGRVKLKASWEGWTTRVEYGIDDDTTVVMSGCKVHKLAVAMHEGGSVDVFMAISSNDVDDTDAGRLFGKLGHEVTLDLLAPAKAHGLIDGTMEAFQKDHPQAGGGAEPEAGDLFAAEHGGGEPAGDDGPGFPDSDTDAGAHASAD